MTDVEQDVDRFRRFRAQLVLKGTNVTEFARALGVLPNHVRLVLQGKRDSQRIEDAVRAWLLEHGQPLAKGQQ